MEKKEDILMSYISDNSSKKQTLEGETNTVRKKVTSIDTFDDEKYQQIPLEHLPCAKFYPEGTRIYIRAATVKEIQAYSVVDNSNRMDVSRKMNALLEKNVRIVNHANETYNYMHLFEIDRLSLIILISRLTRKDKKVLSKDAKCSCGLDIKIEYTPQHFKFAEQNPDIEACFDKTTKTYKLPFITKDIHIAPSKIGMQIDVYNFILDQSLKQIEPNIPLMKIIPWTIEWTDTLDIKTLTEIQNDFENIDDDEFMFINDAIDMSTLGISELVKKCSCGKEVHTEFTFPGGASSIFIIPNAFREFTRK